MKKNNKARHQSFEKTPARQLFSLTYYNSSSAMCKAGYAATEIEQLNNLIIGADMGFMAAILFDPFNLSAYAGMVFLCNCEYSYNFPVALDWCDRYIAAEERLRNTPDSELSFMSLAAKQELVNPTETDPMGDPIRELRVNGCPDAPRASVRASVAPAYSAFRNI